MGRPACGAARDPFRGAGESHLHARDGVHGSNAVADAGKPGNVPEILLRTLGEGRTDFGSGLDYGDGAAGDADCYDRGYRLSDVPDGRGTEAAVRNHSVYGAAWAAGTDGRSAAGSGVRQGDFYRVELPV